MMSHSLPLCSVHRIKYIAHADFIHFIFDTCKFDAVLGGLMNRATRRCVCVRCSRLQRRTRRSGAIEKSFAMRTTSVSPAGRPSSVEWVPKQLGIMSIFRVYGSVLPRCLIWAILGGTAGGLMEGFDWSYVRYNAENPVWRHPYALHVFGMVLGFSLVMRIQIAYQRWWEAATQCNQAASKWADACMQVMTFDEISKDAWSDDALEFRMLILHYASLMHACSLIDMRQDEVYGPGMPTLSRLDPYIFRPIGVRSHRKAGSPDRGGGEPSSPPPLTDSVRLFSSSGNLKPPDLTGSSMRNRLVPLQMVLRTRSELTSRHEVESERSPASSAAIQTLLLYA